MTFFHWNAMIGGLSFTVCYLVNLCKDPRICITFHLPSFTNSPVDDCTKESFKAGEDVLVFYRMTKRCRPDRKYLARTSGWTMKFRKFVVQKQWQIGSRCVWKCLVKIHLGVWVGVGMGMINCRAKKPEVPNMPQHSPPPMRAPTLELGLTNPVGSEIWAPKKPTQKHPFWCWNLTPKRRVGWYLWFSHGIGCYGSEEWCVSTTLWYLWWLGTSKGGGRSTKRWRCQGAWKSRIVAFLPSLNQKNTPRIYRFTATWTKVWVGISLS